MNTEDDEYGDAVQTGLASWRWHRDAEWTASELLPPPISYRRCSL